jgi:hypothetical protein
MYDVMLQLAQERPLFHAEADFQHALAWKLHERHPSASIRLEHPLAKMERRAYVDIRISDSGRTYLLELKYKTRRLDLELKGEQYHLRDQAAQDLGRYDFLKDIERLEHAVTSPVEGGWAIFLTNDSSYWAPLRNSEFAYASFALCEGRALNGRLEWGAQASPGTRRGREAPIVLSGTYALSWREYSVLGQAGYSRFRYLCVPIPAFDRAA